MLITILYIHVSLKVLTIKKSYTDVRIDRSLQQNRKSQKQTYVYIYMSLVYNKGDISNQWGNQ